MTINGKEVNFHLDLGAYKIVQEVLGRNPFGEDIDETAPDVQAATFYACAIRGKSEITMDDVDSMTLAEWDEAKQEVDRLIREFMPEPKKSPLAGKRRKSPSKNSGQ